ncbi:MAG: hypothetical protein ABI602_02875 [Candidatus Saccharibacteria bacterium]
MEHSLFSAEDLAATTDLKQLGATILTFSAGAPLILAAGEISQGQLPTTVKLLCYGGFAVGAILGSKVMSDAAESIEQAVILL